MSIKVKNELEGHIFETRRPNANVNKNYTFNFPAFGSSYGVSFTEDGTESSGPGAIMMPSTGVVSLVQ